MFIAVLTYYLFRVANLSSLKSKLQRSKKGAKVEKEAEKAGDEVAASAQYGAYPSTQPGGKEAGGV